MTNLFDTAAVLADTRQDAIEATLGTDWFERENFGERFLSERDFSLGEDTTDDFDAMADMMWSDPAERDF